MIIAWILLAPIGILLARYFKFLLPNFKIQNSKFWLFVHRLILMLAVLLSFIAFILILADLKWSWVESTSRVSYAHSIIGILTIVFAFLQVLILKFKNF